MIKAGVRFDLSGFDETVDQILEIIDQNVSEIASLVESSARSTSAFADKTGKLRGSIKKKKSKFEYGGYIVVARAPHAHLIEYGHVMIAWGRITGKRVPAHPFMRPAKEKGLRLGIELFKQK